MEPDRPSDTFGGVQVNTRSITDSLNEPFDLDLVHSMNRRFNLLNDLIQERMPWVRATRRWGPTLAPSTLLPGDAVGLAIATAVGTMPRTQHALNLLVDMSQRVDRPHVAGVAASQLNAMTRLFTGVPHFVSSDIAMALMAAEPLEDNLVDSLRLPFPELLVFFDRPIRLPSMYESEPAWVSGAQTAGADYEPVVAYHRDPTTRIDGLVLTAGVSDDGVGVGFECSWIVRHRTNKVVPRRETWAHGVVGTDLDYSTAAPAVRNLAAAVAWGDWIEPPKPADMTDKTIIGSLRHNKTRRLEEQGKLGGVRIINLAARARGDRSASGSGHGVRAHLRRGHWRSVRVATRDGSEIVGDVHGVADIDWHYEGRWIPPTLVKPDAASDGRTGVYTSDDAEQTQRIRRNTRALE